MGEKLLFKQNSWAPVKGVDLVYQCMVFALLHHLAPAFLQGPGDQLSMQNIHVTKAIEVQFSDLEVHVYAYILISPLIILYEKLYSASWTTISWMCPG